jgi:hypothetical protein
MLNGRIYRAAFLPFVLALGVAAFALGSRPAALRTTLAPDAFEGQRAFAELHSLAARFPDRRPAGAGDEGLARYVISTLRGLGGAGAGGFAVHVRHVEGETIEGTQRLTSVIAVRPGSTSASPILILAHRDAAAAGSAGELSGTAALLELARVFAARETKRTIVLASTSGGSGGDAGAAQLGESLEAAGLHGPFDAAIALGDLAGAGLHRPLVVPYSDGFGSAPLQLQRTVADAITREAGWNPGAPSTLGQLAHLSFPAAVGEQGVLDDEGIPAVLVGASGEHVRAGERVTAEHLEGLGRAVLNSVDALDEAPDVSPALQTGLVLQRKTVPEWALRLLLGTLLLPALAAGADGLARLRRRRRSVGRWSLWALSCSLPFLCCAVFCWVLGGLGILGAAPSVPVPGGAIPLDGSAITALAAVGLTFVLSWLLWAALMRRLGIGSPARRPDPDVAGLPAQLILTGVAIVAWIGNPYTALLAVPATHLWLALADPALRPRRAPALVLWALAAAPFALLLYFYAHQLGLGPAAFAWGGVLMLAGGHVGLGSALLWSVAFGCAAAVLLLALRGPEELPGRPSEDPAEITIRGPMSYAGPGSLGGTESALRR